MRGILLVGLAVGLLTTASHAAEEVPAPRLTLVGMEVSENGEEIRALASARREDGTSAKLEDPRILFDGQDSGAALSQVHLNEYAAENPKWVPPISVGMVYQWSQGAPQGMIEGIEGLCRHLPGKVLVYPTPYGQGYRPVITKVTAARAASGDLADYPPIAGDRHKLVEAIRFNANKVIEDNATLKYLVVVTDGRGYEAAREKGPFGAIGEELKKRDIHVLVVSFTSPSDAAESAANVREFVQGAQAQHLVASKLADLPALVESLAEIITGWDRLRFRLPWSPLGKRAVVGMRASVDGIAVEASAGTMSLPGRGRWLFLVIALALLAGGVVVWLIIGNKQRPARARPTLQQAPPGILRDTDQLVRLGLPAERIVVELSQSRPEDLEELQSVDVLKVSKADYPHLASRPGQIRLKETQKLLARSDHREILDEATAQIMSLALQGGVAAADTARRIRARIPSETWCVLARAGEDDLTDTIEAMRQSLPDLASPRGIEFAHLVQGALRTRSDRAVMVGWLVRATGPGERGETLIIQGNPCVLGRRNADIEVPQARDEHATIRVVGPDFILEPVDGEAMVEGRTIEGSHTLADGEVLQIANNAFVFRSVRWAPPLSAPHQRPARRPVRRGSRPGDE
jgi:hypothetical protein